MSRHPARTRARIAAIVATIGLALAWIARAFLTRPAP